MSTPFRPPRELDVSHYMNYKILSFLWILIGASCLAEMTYIILNDGFMINAGIFLIPIGIGVAYRKEWAYNWSITVSWLLFLIFTLSSFVIFFSLFWGGSLRRGGDDIPAHYTMLLLLLASAISYAWYKLLNWIKSSKHKYFESAYI